jgi:hypothetical protein
MSLRNIIKREMEVAFSKNAQPAFVKVLKYLILGIVIYLLWGTKVISVILTTLFTVALAVHFWCRYNTEGWTESFGGWKHDKDANQSHKV